MKQDYYQTLGVEKNADGDTIKKSYRRLAMKYHPDRNPDDKTAEQKFKSIQEAYDVLSNEEKKSAYDRFGHAAFEGGGARQANGDFSSVFDDLFSNFFPGGNTAHNAPRRRILSIRLKFEEAFNGCKKQIRLNEPFVCKTCNGSGAKPGQKAETCGQCRGSGQIRINRGPFIMQQTCGQCRGQGSIYRSPCPTCHGEGIKRAEKTIAVNIPAGIQDGETIRLNISDTDDDFRLRVQVDEHPLFDREGDNLHISIPVSMTIAALGGKVEVPLPSSGKVKVTIPPETQSGAILRLRGRGAPNVRGRESGDMLCHIVIETPINLTESQKKLLRDLEESLRKKQERHSPQEKSWLEKVKSFFVD